MIQNRRTFLKTGFAGIAAFATAPSIAEMATLKRGPSEKLNVAMIGIGKQGRSLLGQFLGQEKDVIVRIICDCDAARRDDGVARVNKYYAEHKGCGVTGTVCRAESDWRKVLDDKDIDAVCIATPDHWHAYITIEAMRLGKDVYCEKPLTYSIFEAESVWKAARRYGRVLQTGAMQRSSGEFYNACEIVRNGLIGKIKHVDCQFGGPSSPWREFEDINHPEKESAPNPDCDFDMWCGPAPLQAYSDKLAPRGVHDFFPDFWRSNDNYGSGGCGDWGAHHMDIMHWGIGRDGSGPVKVIKSETRPSGDAKRGHRRQNGCGFVYDDGMTAYHVGFNPFGTVFYGTDGILQVNRGKFGLWLGKTDMPDDKMREMLGLGTFDGEGLKKVAYYCQKREVKHADGTKEEIDTGTEQYGRSWEEAVKIAGRELGLKYRENKREGFDLKTKLYQSTNHVKDFVKCCRERTKACSNEDVGCYTSVLCQLCNTCYIHDTGFDWNPKAWNFANGTGNKEWLVRRQIRTKYLSKDLIAVLKSKKA